MDEDAPKPIWRTALAALLVVMALSVVGFAIIGTQVSRILSTVGSSVGSFGGPGQNGGDEVGGGDSESGPGEGEADPDGAPGGGDGAIAAFQDASRPDLLIIRTGSIAIQVADIDAALAEAGTAISSIGGYESGSRRSGRGDEAHAEVIYRFPASSWEPALVALRDIGEEVIDEQSETTDVSAEVVDIEARIRNLQVTEAAFQSIMDRAAAIDDVLDVQARLTAVRSEIEQLASKAAHLREQAAMSTLTVTFALQPAPVIARQEARFDPGDEAESATAQLVGIVQALAVAGIWFGIVWLPVLLGLGIVLAIVVVVARRLRGRWDQGAPFVPSGDAAS